jgi:hypothetical protein
VNKLSFDIGLTQVEEEYDKLGDQHNWSESWCNSEECKDLQNQISNAQTTVNEMLIENPEAKN